VHLVAVTTAPLDAPPPPRRRRQAEKPLEKAKGRPAVYGTPQLRRFYVRMTDDLRADLETVAEELGLTLTDVMRDAVDEFVADYRERKLFVERRVSYRRRVQADVAVERRRDERRKL